MNFCVGGPDFPKQRRPRRTEADAPIISLDDFTALMSARCEYQIRADVEFLPGLWSLCFASKVNRGMTMSWSRALRRSGHDGTDPQKVIETVKRLYHLLWHGQYRDSQGRLVPVRGNISKLPQAMELSKEEKALIANYHFLSARVPGTRQIRNSIRHMIFASRIFYGIPVFITITPSIRHSRLLVRLFRGRRTDPAFTSCAANLAP